MLSAFGATWNPTDRDPVSTCSQLAYHVKENNLDGLDLDYEDNEAMNKGRAEDWLIQCTKTIRQILPKGEYLLTHAPQAPISSDIRSTRTAPTRRSTRRSVI